MNGLYPIIGAAALGALFMSRSKPKTKCLRKSLLGTRTGATYQVEDFIDAGFIVVTAADGSRAIFQRRAASPSRGTGFAWQHGRGSPSTLRAIYTDIMGDEPPKSAVGPKAVPTPGAAARPKAAASGPAPAPKAKAPDGKQATRGTP